MCAAPPYLKFRSLPLGFRVRGRNSQLIRAYYCSILCSQFARCHIDFLGWDSERYWRIWTDCWQIIFWIDQFRGERSAARCLTWRSWLIYARPGSNNSVLGSFLWDSFSEYSRANNGCAECCTKMFLPVGFFQEREFWAGGLMEWIRFIIRLSTFSRSALIASSSYQLFWFTFEWADLAARSS